MTDTRETDLWAYFATGHRVMLRVPEGESAESFRAKIRAGEVKDEWLDVYDGGIVQLSLIALLRVYERVDWQEMEGLLEADPDAQPPLYASDVVSPHTLEAPGPRAQKRR